MQKPNLKTAQNRTKNKVPIIQGITINNKKLGAKKNYFIKTYGCQMNEHDSEKIKAIMEAMQYQETTILEKSDVIILNSCSIRENANNKLFGYLASLKPLKERNPNLVIILAGCMSQEEIVVEKIIAKYQWLDLVLGTHNIIDLPKLLEETINQKQQVIEVFSKEGEIYEGLPVKRANQYKAWVNIMYGCDKFCTYCIVPYTRGKQRSRAKKDIIAEINSLIAEGYQEITLLGQNVNAYGKDLDEKYYFSNLLTEIAQLPIKRIRFLTNHPWDFDLNLVEIIQQNKNIMPHIHLPLQSGSNKILKMMGRNYSQEEYIKLFKNIKKIPNISITTDIIVGFPNENEEHFNETLAVVKQCQFDSAFTFLFSPRTGTPAAKLKDDVSINEKEKRLQILNKLINEDSLKANQKLISKIVSVLIEGPSKKNKNYLTGYTDTLKRVNVKTDKSIIGKIVEIEIITAKTWSLEGKII